MITENASVCVFLLIPTTFTTWSHCTDIFLCGVSLFQVVSFPQWAVKTWNQHFSFSGNLMKNMWLAQNVYQHLSSTIGNFIHCDGINEHVWKQVKTTHVRTEAIYSELALAREPPSLVLGRDWLRGSWKVLYRKKFPICLDGKLLVWGRWRQAL